MESGVLEISQPQSSYGLPTWFFCAKHRHPNPVVAAERHNSKYVALSSISLQDLWKQ
uniref:Uncharacterized protein n=1 Tax=Arundo donax TaxID=35708 RepID=A0A0A9G9Q1_ARUDO